MSKYSCDLSLITQLIKLHIVYVIMCVLTVIARARRRLTLLGYVIPDVSASTELVINDLVLMACDVHTTAKTTLVVAIRHSLTRMNTFGSCKDVIFNYKSSIPFEGKSCQYICDLVLDTVITNIPISYCMLIYRP